MDNFAGPELPRHARIAADLRRAIGSGELAVGERLPPEFELMGRYDVARGTVRQMYFSPLRSGIPGEIVTGRHSRYQGSP